MPQETILSSSTIKPETYIIPPTPHVPNSRFPIILYRNALPFPTAQSAAAAIERNDWLRGGQWKAYYHAHFHAVTHECYGVIAGAAVFNLGRAPQDEEVDAETGKRNGLQVRFNKGDVFVLPAGISHCVLEDLGDFEYVGFYPPNPERKAAGEEAFDMHLCDASPEETQRLKVVAARTRIPDTDPLYGIGGPLPRMWLEVDRAEKGREVRL